MRESLSPVADSLVATQRGEGYPALISGATPYPWGSNSAVVNRMVLLGTAYDLTRDRAHLKAMHRAMDYLLGPSPPPAAPPPSPTPGPARRQARGVRRRTPSTGTRRSSGSRPTSSRPPRT
ncbi:glycoside hydrolase family 9 protein [Streptomyces sp. S4.7]|uniref:glycoside hydrolase family 9 protein n=1 Tax=Streptomyces sp. S4.7 TaxID=2705439 RepID=UPI00193F34C0|nr:glycoside hydrolase family 9 protein [Streptomyces sp. S4.7]